ncbi:hypothetical protein ABIF91_003335 [Bradyrhizobium sp. USDA 241]
MQRTDRLATVYDLSPLQGQGLLENVIERFLTQERHTIIEVKEVNRTIARTRAMAESG